MFKLKKIMHILVALLLAVVAGGLVWYYVMSMTPSKSVVVATKQLNIGTIIKDSDVTIKRYPDVAIPKTAVTDKGQVIGKTVVSGVVFEGDVLRTGHVSEGKGSLQALLTTIAPGREAIDLPEETAPGLSGVSEGDVIKVYTEYQLDANTTIVDIVANEAVVLKTPSTLEKGSSKPAYIIAVKPNEAKLISDGIVRGKKFAVSLLPLKRGQ